MSLEIRKIQKNGDASQEYILLKATEAVNLSSYAVVDRTFDKEGNLSNIYRHFFRFASHQVKKGEYVALWTKKGSYQLGTLNDGGTAVHMFYWGSDAPIWNDDNIENAEVLKVETVDKKTTGHPAPPKVRKLKLRPDNLKFGGK